MKVFTLEDKQQHVEVSSHCNGQVFNKNVLSFFTESFLLLYIKLILFHNVDALYAKIFN
jgi:hypothetical protein